MSIKGNTMMMNGTGCEGRGRRRYRVKSPVRFITFLVIAVCMIVGGLGFVTGANESTASVLEDYHTYTVSSGDTLWSIAEEYKSDGTDIRKAVYVISQLNDMHAEDLYPGDELIIPTEL
ncbi:MAG: LysM peptidoglycan-binding domain-containing protein [Firmicutes bacterium]|nr:LysM peptidoglycan-binding domain-containing protein [Bacillota bacterium]